MPGEEPPEAPKGVSGLAHGAREDAPAGLVNENGAISRGAYPVNVVPVQREQSALSHVKLFFALSRTPHGLLDMATPALAALLWYGAFPPLRIILLGFMTAFAGYTAVYALNDLVDYRVDKAKLERGGFRKTEDYLDSVMIRHPMAYGLLTCGEALLWAMSWAVIAVIGAYLLNPLCVVIFAAACLLETVYCLMWRTSHLRTLVSGAVKTSGGVAAVFAVDPNPSPVFLALLFLWLFLWEIGGQNIPADWTDIEEDRSLDARTIPVRFGPARSASIIFWSLAGAVFLNGILLGFGPATPSAASTLACAGAGVYLLLGPAYRLRRKQGRPQAVFLFNRASYYPLSLLAVTVLRIII
jgi:4-hydroxybenzoate polyprenyltransferase